jgi:RHS repeat-associated protein
MPRSRVRSAVLGARLVLRLLALPDLFGPWRAYRPGRASTTGSPRRRLRTLSVVFTQALFLVLLLFSGPSSAMATEGLGQAPSSSRLTSPTEGIRTARRLKLQSAWVKAGVTGVTYEFREGGTGPFETIPLALVQKRNGEAIGKWPMPTSGFESEPLYFDAAHGTQTLREKGGSIEVRALFEGPSEVKGYSAPVEAGINRFIGGPKDATAQIGPGTVDLLTGNLTISRSDVSVPNFTNTLQFSRTFNSRGIAPKGSPEDEAEQKSVLGPGWRPGVPIEAAGGSEWRNLKIVTQFVESEGITWPFEYAVLTDLEGGELGFEKLEGGGYRTPPEAAGWKLTTEGSRFVLSDPAGNRTTFENPGGGSEYVPVTISQVGGATNTTRVEYELKEGRKRVHMVLGPSAQQQLCSTEADAKTLIGCHALFFSYAPASTWGAPASDGERLSKITYYVPGYGGYAAGIEVAAYNYNAEGRLVEEWDPRVTPKLAELYTYTSGGQLTTLTPAGQRPWTLEYGTVDGEVSNGRLMAVKRDSLLTSPSTAQTTLAYGVPVSGSGSPYPMGASAVSEWGQLDSPTDATAVFPPTEIPASPPTSYAQAAVYYMDAEGHGVNMATPAGAGTSSPSISTTEEDDVGNVVRELTPQNRLLALAEPPANRATRARELDTHRLFSADGTQMEEEWGTSHSVQLSSGPTVQARFHKVVQYDHGWPETGIDPHLPTRETSGALVGGEVLDQRVTEHFYNWNLRKPTETIVDAGTGHLNIKRVTVYNETTGLPIETRQPSNAAAGATRTYYYDEPGAPTECQQKPRWGSLPCVVKPVGQASGAGRPELLVKRLKAFNALGEVTELTESPGGSTEGMRKTTSTYDLAGRQLTQKVEGGGVAVPIIESFYSSTMGLPTVQRFACTGGCTDDQATTIVYDALGRVKEYSDADGNVAKTTYDLDGRPVSVADNKGSQTLSYDPISGLAIKLEDSGAGTFTASYDANGSMVEEALPNGLNAKTSYDPAGQPTTRTYTKTSACGASCTWFSEQITRSVFGQVVSANSTSANDTFAYDRAGRLLESRETPTGGGCTVRIYAYDVDSNRTELTSRSPGAGGVCAASGGSVQKQEYDTADRLEGEGLVYDGFGRVTSLPAKFAGGSTLTATYFANDLVSSQTQSGVSNSYELDASVRQRARLQSGGLEGSEVFHYDEGSDVPAWTERATSWTRDVLGLDGEVVALQEGSGKVTFQLTNLHGDVVATAEASPEATKLNGEYRYDEFGNHVAGSAGQYGWLGAKSRRTELASGVVQMGVRSYAPEIGRFLSPDPIPGGSASPYDYADADPVNGFDLQGTCATHQTCGGTQPVGGPIHGGGSGAPAPPSPPPPPPAAPTAPASTPTAPPERPFGGGRAYVGVPTHLKDVGCTFWGPVGGEWQYQNGYWEANATITWSCGEATSVSAYMYTANGTVGPVFKSPEGAGGLVHLYVGYWGQPELKFCVLFVNLEGSKRYCGGVERR